MSDDDKRTERRGLSTQNIIIIAVVCGLAVALVIAAMPEVKSIEPPSSPGPMPSSAAS